LAPLSVAEPPVVRSPARWSARPSS
jgi:hypothetical protein